MRREKIKLGQYRITKHAAQQQKERSIDLIDILHVLKNGVHESEKTLATTHGSWKYAIKGEIEDERTIRVIISLEAENDMIIITVIDISK